MIDKCISWSKSGQAVEARTADGFKLVRRDVVILLLAYTITVEQV